MKISLLRLPTLIFAVLLLTSANAEDGFDITHFESLQNLELYRTSSSGAQKAGIDPIRHLSFDAFSQRFEIKLQSNRSLLNQTQRNALAPEIGVYRGNVAGAANSWVRLVVVDGVPRGLLSDGQDLYAVEPGNENTGPVIFRLDDLEIEPGMLACSDVGEVRNASTLMKGVIGEITAAAAIGPGATQQMDMAIIGDFEFTTAKGGSAQADLVARMNNVDGIFSAQLSVQLNVNQIDAFSSSNDPFTDESEAGALLDELADYRNTTPAQNANGLTHLFTGRELDSNTVGVAFTSAICSRGFGAGLTEATHSLTIDSLIAAHEIGHNFGAPHDGVSGSACEAETGAFIMAPSVNGSDQFSSCSIAEMQARVANANCLSAVASTDVAVVAGSQPAAVLLGNAAAVEFAANSTGTDDATDVAVDVTIPSGATLTSVTTSAGSCTSGAGSVSCSLGTIAGGSGETVTLNVETTATGTISFNATISATTDENSNNNQSTIQLTTNPAVDLVATAAGNAQVELNRNTTIQPAIENRAILAATDVTVTVTPDAGLQIDSASWAPGSCTIAAGVATCEANSLAAQSNNSVSLQVTGTTEGSQSYSMSATAAEADRDTANNDATGQVTVSPVSTNTSDSGGGSFSLLTLLLLALTRVVVLRSNRL